MLSSYTDEFKDKYLLKEYDFQVPVRHFEWYKLYIDFTKKIDTLAFPLILGIDL